MNLCDKVSEFITEYDQHLGIPLIIFVMNNILWNFGILRYDFHISKLCLYCIEIVHCDFFRHLQKKKKIISKYKTYEMNFVVMYHQGSII